MARRIDESFVHSTAFLIGEVVCGPKGQQFADFLFLGFSQPHGRTRFSQRALNISRAFRRRQRTVGSSRPTIAATSEQGNPSRSRSINTVRYFTGISASTK